MLVKYSKNTYFRQSYSQPPAKSATVIRRIDPKCLNSTGTCFVRSLNSQITASSIFSNNVQPVVTAHLAHEFELFSKIFRQVSERTMRT